MTSSSVDSLSELLRRWSKQAAPPAERPAVGRSTSAGIPLARFYGDEAPGVFPFTRGTTATGYADGLWVMGMYSGYGTPRETNERFRRLLEAGQTGLSVALDLPTQMGLDSDHPLADGEVGKVGTPLDTVDDLIAAARRAPARPRAPDADDRERDRADLRRVRARRARRARGRPGDRSA